MQSRDKTSTDTGFWKPHNPDLDLIPTQRLCPPTLYGCVFRCYNLGSELLMMVLLSYLSNISRFLFTVHGAAPGLVPSCHQCGTTQQLVDLSVLSHPQILGGPLGDYDRSKFSDPNLSIGPLSPSIRMDFVPFSSAVYFVPLSLCWLTDCFFYNRLLVIQTKL